MATVSVIRLEDRYHYAVPMTRDAHRALAWIADRYSSAEVLYDGSRWLANVLLVPESTAWEYLAALPEDNGVPDAILPPCAGGPLADALVALWEKVA